MKYESSLTRSQHPNSYPSRETYRFSPSPPRTFSGVRLGEVQTLISQ